MSATQPPLAPAGHLREPGRPGRHQQQVASCCLPAVYARDGGLPPRLSKATVRVQVGDENDHAPHLESQACTLQVPENQSRVALHTLRATDPDAGDNGRLQYLLAGGHHSWQLLFTESPVPAW